MNFNDREVCACGEHLTSVFLVPRTVSHLQAIIDMVIRCRQNFDVSGFTNDTKVLNADHGWDLIL